MPSSGSWTSSFTLDNWTCYGYKPQVVASGCHYFLTGDDAPDGSIALALERASAASQSVTVPETGVYELTFLYCARKDNSKFLNGRVYALLDGESFGYVDVHQANAFRTAYMKVYATAGVHTLAISNSVENNEQANTVIDTVSMNQMTTNLVSNPSFEDNVFSSTLSTYRNVGANDYPEAWDWSGTVVYTKANTAYSFSEIPDGDIVMVMRNYASLSQTIIAPTTGLYEVTLKYAKRPKYDAASPLSQIYAKINGEMFGSVTVWTNAMLTAHFYTNLIAGQSYTLSFTNNVTKSGASLSDYAIDLVTAAFTTNIIKNGSFDAGCFTNMTGYCSDTNAIYYFSNPHWTTTSGTVGLEKWMSSTWHGKVDVGTYCLYMQTKSGSAAAAVKQTFNVTDPGVYALSFHHVCRVTSREAPVTRVRIYSGNGTSGSVVFEGSVTSLLGGTNGVWGEFSSEVRLAEAGEYTLEFFRTNTSSYTDSRADISAIIDDVCLAWRAKIQKGLVISIY